MNPLHVLLLLLLFQNSQSRQGGYHLPGGTGSLRFSGLDSLPDPMYIVSSLRQTLDAVERISQMTSMVQQIPGMLGNNAGNPPEAPANDTDYNLPAVTGTSSPDIAQLVQNLGPLLQMLGNSSK